MYLKTNLCQPYFEMQFFTDEAPMSSEAIVYVRHSWFTYSINFYNSRMVDQ